MNAHAPISIEYFGALIVKKMQDVLGEHTDDIRIIERRQNYVYGAQQAIVEFDGQQYRMILAPIDCPVRIGSQLADEHFTGGLVR